MFLLEVISPVKKVFSGSVEKLTVPSTSGELTILSHHQPLFTSLEMGRVVFVDDQNKTHEFTIGKGLLEVEKEKVSLLIEDVRSLQEISEQEALRAKKRAEVILKAKPKKEEMATAMSAFRRSLIDLRLSRKKKQRKI